MDEQQRYARPDARGPRRHMGVATSDPEYLPPVKGAALSTHGARLERGASDRASHDRSSHPAPHGDRPARMAHQVNPGGQPNYGRYISSPKKGRSIFTSRQVRQRRRVKMALAMLIGAAAALALFWFFALR